ncbi:hypothetical protein B5807_00046 [Epicoccum nigrum]|uniref:Uncharacterized protein n=1 Tax=Epicoccum nigrum TaxID=105696 RepID=A0A1Y2MCA1_EPING|nr:hypothetical protein B5807_00046 [Epicoccum nigrum]
MVDHDMANVKDRCTSKELFPASKEGRTGYQYHLMDDHDVEEDDLYEYSWGRVRGYDLPERPGDDEMPAQEEEQPVRVPRTRKRPLVLDDSDE